VIKRHTGPIRSVQAVCDQRERVEASCREMAARTQERILVSQHLSERTAKAAKKTTHLLMWLEH
jgi:hypothetical protein